jgi:hypothetical protein
MMMVVMMMRVLQAASLLPCGNTSLVVWGVQKNHRKNDSPMSIHVARRAVGMNQYTKTV